jgi:2-oxoglutarate dehydrogenase complex dehydrogenase (E1) component-like enzyme
MPIPLAMQRRRPAGSSRIGGEAMLPKNPLTKATAHKGMEVIVEGQFRGFIREIHDGKLDGMADVELRSGTICTSLSEVEAADA